MLAFALDYRAAIDVMTEDRKTGLRKYELSEEEWSVAEQLRDVLKVSRRPTKLRQTTVVVGRASLLVALLSRSLSPRSSTMLFSSSRAPTRTYPPSSRPWTTSTKSSPTPP